MSCHLEVFSDAKQWLGRAFTRVREGTRMACVVMSLGRVREGEGAACYLVGRCPGTRWARLLRRSIETSGGRGVPGLS
jgi:hypothetical protein